MLPNLSSLSLQCAPCGTTLQSAPVPTLEERTYINYRYGLLIYQSASEEEKAAMIADARDAMRLLDQLPPEPFDPARDGINGTSRRAMALRARNSVLDAQRYAQQRTLAQRINEILEERGETGVPRSNLNHMALYIFKDDLMRIIRMYPEYPPGDELTAMRERAEAFLAAVDVMDLWTRLGIRGEVHSDGPWDVRPHPGPTEESITNQVTSWFIEYVE